MKGENHELPEQTKAELIARLQLLEASDAKTAENIKQLVDERKEIIKENEQLRTDRRNLAESLDEWKAYGNKVNRELSELKVQHDGLERIVRGAVTILNATVD